MLTFFSFFKESLDVDKLKHLEHAEDHIIHGGEEGLTHAANNLDDLHSFLTGGKSKSKVTTKYDGSPSVVYGIHPETKKFFVGSKSVFNVNPKINYTPQDIDKNHGHAPGLAEKLKHALEHLPKIMPKEGGVYQGDFLYDKNDVDDSGDHYKFAPNTITYSAHKDSSQGRKIAASKIGFVTHTKYTGKDLTNMKAGFDVDHSKFQQDPDVNHINPEIKDASTARYSTAMQKKYKDHMAQAAEHYKNTPPEALEKLATHDEHLKPYINQTVRDGTEPNVRDYVSHLEQKRNKEVDKVKTPAAKDKKASTYDNLINDIKDNHKHFENIFGIHKHLQKAKDVLVNALGNPTEFKHTVGGKEVKPEGFVSIRGGKPTKLVDRAEFSRLNFANNRGRGEGAPTDSDTTTKPEERDTKNPHVLAFGRMNPPTIGHGALVDKVKELADANKAKHTVVLSHSQDQEKNPLSIDQKLKHAKRFFPGINIIGASNTLPTFIHHAKDLHKKGVDHLIMVGGSDRVDEYKKILDKYNGPGKDFNFKRIDVVSAGERDPDAEGVTGMSASKMRLHAINRNFNEFKKGIPTHVHSEHAKELYDEIRKAMHIDIGPETSAISLSRYAKRDDEVGHRARAEQKRRESRNTITSNRSGSSNHIKSIKPSTAKRSRKHITERTDTGTSTGISSSITGPTRISTGTNSSITDTTRIHNSGKKEETEEKKFYNRNTNKEKNTFKEEVTTSDIRGLGLVTGVPGGSLSNYVSDNISSADTSNDILKKFISIWHTNLHNKVKF